jgi:hypothetical protein
VNWNVFGGRSFFFTVQPNLMYLSNLSRCMCVVFFFRVCALWPYVMICWTTCLNASMLYPLSGCCPGGYKTHDGMDSDGNHHSSGGDPRYTPDPNRPLEMRKRQIGDIIRKTATPCMLQYFECYCVLVILEFIKLYIRSGVIQDTVAYYFMILLHILILPQCSFTYHRWHSDRLNIEYILYGIKSHYPTPEWSE